MIYLIDGHNLIGKMPDIDLADPDDEQQLIRRLQNWSAGDRRRRIELFFDSGPVGGLAMPQSGLGIKVQYARLGQTADDLLIRSLERVRNRQAYTLVTSDREIIATAHKRGIKYLLSEKFASLLVDKETTPALMTTENDDLGTAEDPKLSEADIQDWLERFKEQPSFSPPQPPQRQISPHAHPHQPPPISELKAGANMTQEELEEWLTLFDEPAESPPPS